MKVSDVSKIGREFQPMCHCAMQGEVCQQA